MKLMKTYAATVIAAAMMAPLAMADDITITTGYEGGSYHGVFGRNMSMILTEQGHEVETVSSAGSIENLNRVAGGEADLGFAQADAYMFWSTRNTGNVEVIGSLGKECLFVATGENSGIDGEGDLQNKKIAVGEKGSGSAVSWQYAQQLEPDYLDTSTFFQTGALALSKVKSGQLDAFFWVTSPGNLDHKFIRAVMAEGSDLKMIDFDNWGMNDDLPTGEPVYEFRDITIAKGMIFDTEVEVPCTDVLVIGSPDMGTDALEDTASALLMNSNRIQGN